MYLRAAPKCRRADIARIAGEGTSVANSHRQRWGRPAVRSRYRELVGVKARSDTSDARPLAAYAAAPDEVRNPIMLNCRKMRSARHLANLPAVATSLNR